MKQEFHEPVMVSEVMSLLLGEPRKVIVDCTVGDGGHSLEILSRTRETFVVGLDIDRDALSIARARLREAYPGRFAVVRGDYRELPKVLARLGIPEVDGALFDLGVSSRQLDTPGRGFSYWQDGPLDMRMNQDGGLSAQDIVMGWSEEDLARVIREYGEERFSGRIAREIVKTRKETLLRTTKDLVSVIERAIPAHTRFRGAHPARRTFQALRIALNDELSRLGISLRQAVSLLRPKGVIAVLTYHSLEDRIVKSEFKSMEEEGLVTRLTRRPLRVSEAEVVRNARSRSAKLRAIRKSDLSSEGSS